MMSLLKICSSNLFNSCCNNGADFKYKSACCEKDVGANVEMTVTNNNTPRKCLCSLLGCISCSYSSNTITPQLPTTSLQEKK